MIIVCNIINDINNNFYLVKKKKKKIPGELSRENIIQYLHT